MARARPPSGSGPTADNPRSGVADDGHAEPFDRARHIEVAPGQGNTDLAFRTPSGLIPAGDGHEVSSICLLGESALTVQSPVRSGPLDIDQPRLGTRRLRHGRRPDCNSAPVLTWDDVGGVPKNSAGRSRQSRASDDSLGLCPAIRDVVAVTGLLPARRDSDRSPDAATWQDLAS